MIDIGSLKDARFYTPEQMRVSEMLGVEGRNHLVMMAGNAIDATTQNAIAEIGVVPYKEWRVVGVGLVCIEHSVDNQDPVLHFGTRADPDAVGIMTTTTPTDTEWKEEDYSSADLLDLLPADVLTEITVAWTEAGSGSIYGIWQNTIKQLQVKTTVADNSEGQWIPFVIVEIAGQGRF